LAAIAIAKSKAFAPFHAANRKAQVLLFLVTANLPALLTGRMSYVDIAWPWGLAAIGLLSKLKKQSSSNFVSRENLISLMYLFAGLRMGLGGLLLNYKGHLKHELPRYLFQRRRWAKRGVTPETPFSYNLTMQIEIFAQALANLGMLCVPAVLCAFSYIKEKRLHPLEKLGMTTWVLSFCLEHLADTQKNSFALLAKEKGLKNQVCNVGLWAYSRHPNYFFEWCVWMSLCITSLPSLKAFWETDKEELYVKLGVTLGWLLVPFGMYQCLVNWTGAKPAEFYSLQKRPEYADYQKSVNMFFPGFPKI